MEGLTFQLFPPGLSGSVITCVFVGLVVVTFFNLRLGWVLSGLVVPGYLVPLVTLKPWSVVAILVEATVTYLLVWLYSERLNRLAPWSGLFGRDRFFALLVTSVVVRLVFDGWVFPAVGEWLNARYALEFDFRSNLHSFGLVIVTLIANLFWKPGLIRGLAALGGILGATLLIVHGLLIPWTNFSLTSLQYLYEDLATSLLAGPKAYIILLSAAFIASRMNLFYGWEYSGILIPSLLALQWYQPFKIAASFAEAFVILGIAHLLLRSPMLRNAHIEGARKLLLFFSIGYAYKWLLALALVRWAPYVKVTDAFAFGYLLSTLMALKMHDKEMAGVLTRANLQTSLTAVVLATAVGYLLTLLPLDRPPAGQEAVQAAFTPAAAAPPATSGDLLTDLRNLKPEIYARNRTVPVPGPRDLDRFDRALELLDRYLDSGDTRPLKQARAHLAAVGYELLRVQGRYLLLREQDPLRGWGVYVLDEQPRRSLLVEVPAPAEERGTLDAGAWLFRLEGAQALAVAGAPRNANPDRSTDVLTTSTGFFERFHRRFGSEGTLQVRTYTAASLRQWLRVRGRSVVESGSPPPPTLWVSGRLPPALDMGVLQQALPGLRVLWQAPRLPNHLRRLSRGGFAELFLDTGSLRRLLAASIRGRERARMELRVERIDGYLQRWLLEDKPRLAVRGSHAYRPPNIEDLFYFDEEILTPLLALVRDSRRPDWNRTTPPEALDTIASAASVMGYRVVWYRHRRTGRRYILLQERLEEPEHRPRHWGTYVFRLGPALPLVVQIPRPGYERNSFEYGVALFERLQADTLLIAGAHPMANADGSADPVLPENVASLFNLVHQTRLRESWEHPLSIVQVRAFHWKPQMGQTPPDAILAPGAGLPLPDPPDPVLARLIGTLEQDGLELRAVDGSPVTAGYEAVSLPQALYPAVVPHKAFYALWLSPFTRAAFRPVLDSRVQRDAFLALGLPAEVHWDVPDVLPSLLRSAGTAPLPPGARELLQAYIRHGDVPAVAEALARWPELRLARIVDLDTGQVFLLLRSAQGSLLALANLNPLVPGRTRYTDPHHAEDAVRAFVDERSGWLVFQAP